MKTAVTGIVFLVFASAFVGDALALDNAENPMTIEKAYERRADRHPGYSLGAFNSSEDFTLNRIGGTVKGSKSTFGSDRRMRTGGFEPFKKRDRQISDD